MKKILVPTDFSPNAARAIDYAVQIAKINQASIYLVHACELLDTTFKDKLPFKEDFNKKITDEAFDKLEMLRSSIEETEQVLVNTQLYNGPVTDTILLAAREHEVDLVIMGTMGHSGLKGTIFGSKTAGIIAHCEKPVLAIPLEYEWSVPERILLAINDFDKVADKVNAVFELADVFNAKVKIVVFTDEDKAEAIDYIRNARFLTRAEAVLEQKYPGTGVDQQQLTGHRLEDTINDYIQDHHIDMLALVTHHRNLVKSIFHPSFTRHMSYRAKVPVLAIPDMG